MGTQPWVAVAVQLPRENVVVDTKIDDEHGERNEAPLKRQGRLWYFADGSMYVYYTPTHWRDALASLLVEPPPGERSDADQDAGQLPVDGEG